MDKSVVLDIYGDSLIIDPLLERTFYFLIWIDNEVAYLMKDNTWITLRSQMICIFAYMETIVCLYAVFKAWRKLTENEVKSESLKNAKKFINSYMLNFKNKYYKDNYVMFKWINSNSLKELRNMLTHFYSVSDSLWIIHDMWLDRSSKSELEEKWHYFISPIELYKLLQWASNALIKDRNSESKKDGINFSFKMKNVIEIVELNAAHITEIWKNI
jgi:hypothetical protein